MNVEFLIARYRRLLFSEKERKIMIVLVSRPYGTSLVVTLAVISYYFRIFVPLSPSFLLSYKKQSRHPDDINGF